MFPACGGNPCGRRAAVCRLHIDSLTFAYPGGREARDIDAKIDPGDWVLTGENGSGKTTLSRLIMGLAGSGGEIRWQGKIRRNGRLPQSRDDRLCVPATGIYVYRPECVGGADLQSSWRGVREEASGAVCWRARFLLEKAGLTGRLQMSPYLLSQGRSAF